MDAVSLLREGLLAKGIELSAMQGEQFERFTAMFLEKSKQMNLSAITSEEGIAVLHYLDSLTLLDTALIHEGARVIDIGCGAGFPGVPLAIMRPDIALTLLDATKKKLSFVQEAVKSLGLSGAQTVAARAEELAHDRNYRERFDIATSRAVANLSVLCEIALPFVAAGGYLLALKGEKAEEEAQEAQKKVMKMGAIIQSVNDVTLYQSDRSHHIVVIKKLSPTPKEYPRAYGKIVKG